MFQRFALKSGRTRASDVSLFSLGPTVVYQMQQAPTQAFLTGGIAIYHATRTKARVPASTSARGIELPAHRLLGHRRSAHARDARGRTAVLTLPLTVGVKF